MAEVKVGVVGTGFIGSHLAMAVDSAPGATISKVLTRRSIATVAGYPDQILTNSIDQFLSAVDVVVECSGDPIWATEVISRATTDRVPVVTMNTEFHITAGSAFVDSGLVTEAAGDQPGALAELHEDAVAMGFSPVVYGNMKGFLNPDPEPEVMRFWGEKQGISLPMVTSFTDGTKVQAEQILVANHFGAGIAAEGMLGPAVNDLEEGVAILVEHHEKSGRPISDYVVSSVLPHGVFIVARHDDRQREALEYFKLGPGPYYTLIKNNIFVHLEILKTVFRMVNGGDVLLDNSSEPEISLGAVAKGDLAAGTPVASGIGSFELRGHAIRIEDNPDHVPIGLIRDAVIARSVSTGQLLSFDDIELPPSQARDLWTGVVSANSRRESLRDAQTGASAQTSRTQATTLRD